MVRPKLITLKGVLILTMNGRSISQNFNTGTVVCFVEVLPLGIAQTVVEGLTSGEEEYFKISLIMQTHTT